MAKVLIEQVDGRVQFTFTESSHYQYNGTADWPLNSLSMTIDSSDMVTFKNQAGDIVYSILLTDLEKTKAEMEELYSQVFVGSTGGGGVTPEDVQTAIDDALAPVNQDITDLSNDVAVKEEVTARALHDLHENKQDKLTAGSGITISGNVISAEGGSSVTVDPTLDSGSTNAVANSAITTVILDDEYVAAQALTELKLNKLDASAYTRVTVDQSIDTASTNAISNAAVGNALNTKGDSLQMDSSPTALNRMDIRLRRGSTALSTARINLGDHLVYGGSGGGTTLSVSDLVASTSITSLVRISQADYDALVQAGTVDPSVLYIISNALNP